MPSLEALGWGPFFESQLPGAADLTPARVCEEQRGAYHIYTEHARLSATVAGRLLHESAARDGLPAVGDWVIARRLPGEERAVITAVLERRTKLSRKAAGERTDEQIIAVNVDVVFLVSSLNQELNLRRIERYLAVIWESGARPVILLNKCDLNSDTPRLQRQVTAIAPAVEIIATSAVTGDGLAPLRDAVAAGQTAVFVGSSGVGKSSLINALLGDERQAVRHVREDDARGRHTTTARQMLLLPAGGIVIDTPGLRELQLWESESGMGQAFSDVASLAEGCLFADCRHNAEPGCAVQEALSAGSLDLARMESYRKLLREQAFIAGKQDQAVRLQGKKRWKQITKANRQRQKTWGR